MATIRHSLQTEIFRPIDERLMTFVHVYKPHKKRKTSNFLCLTVTKEAPIVFYIHQVCDLLDTFFLTPSFEIAACNFCQLCVNY